MSNEQKALAKIRTITGFELDRGIADGILERIQAIADAALASTEPEQEEVCELALCESHFLCLKPDVLYRFTVREGCDECANAAGEASIFPPEINQVHCEHPASEGEDCKFCNGDGIIRGEAPGGKVVEVAYCPNQCKSSSTEGEE